MVRRINSLLLRYFYSTTKFFVGRNLGQKFPLLKQIYQLVERSLRPAKIKVFDQWLFLHHEDRELANNLILKGTFEDFESNLFRNLIKENMVVFDIGANIGYYTIIAAQKVGPLGRVYAFEPDRENYNILQKNIRLNNHANVNTIECAVSDKDGDLELYLSNANKGDHRTYKAKEDFEVEDRKFYKVKAVSLDNLFSSTDVNPSAIKMDIQGFEFFALTGMKEIINRVNNLILFTEFWPDGLVAAGLASPSIYYEELKKYGFEIFKIDESKRMLSKVDNVEQILNPTPGEYYYTNLLCFKGSFLGSPVVEVIIKPDKSL